MDILSVLGVAFGGGGLVIGLYQYRKQKEMERRIERKDDLKGFADTLEEIDEWIEEFESQLRDPGKESAVLYRTRDLFKEYYTHYSLTDEFPEAKLSICYFKSEQKKLEIGSPEEFMEAIDEDKSPVITLELPEIEAKGEDNTFVHLDRVFSGGRKFLYQHSKFSDQHYEYLDEFAPGLLQELESEIENVIERCVEEAFSHEPYPKMSSLNSETIDDVAESCIEQILFYDGLEDDLDRISELRQEVNDTRKRALQTSYS